MSSLSLKNEAVNKIQTWFRRIKNKPLLSPRTVASESSEVTNDTVVRDIELQMLLEIRHSHILGPLVRVDSDDEDEIEILHILEWKCEWTGENEEFIFEAKLTNGKEIHFLILKNDEDIIIDAIKRKMQESMCYFSDDFLKTFYAITDLDDLRKLKSQTLYELTDEDKLTSMAEHWRITDGLKHIFNTCGGKMNHDEMFVFNKEEDGQKADYLYFRLE